MDKRYHYERYEDYSQDSLRYTSVEETGNEVLIITIDIGDGRKDELLVREDDDPRALAENFCHKHKLGAEVRQALIEQIEQNLEFHPEDDISTLISVNKSYESRAKKSIQEPPRNANLHVNENPSAPLKPAPASFEEKLKKIESRPEVKEQRQSRSPMINNYGEKLYLKGIRFIQNVNKKKTEYLQQRTEKEMKDTTFRPKINSNRSDRQQVQEMLLRKGREKQEHIERKRGEKLAEELSACTFSPLICKNSEKLLKSNEPVSPDRFEKLYVNAKATQNKISMVNAK